MFDPPLDAGIAPLVESLFAAGVETFESCEGGEGHAYPEPTARFHGDRAEGYRAVAIAIGAGFAVKGLRRVWPLLNGELTGPYWEITLTSPADSVSRIPSRAAFRPSPASGSPARCCCRYCTRCCCDEPTVSANAQAMAAAPDMLAALEAVAEQIRHQSPDEACRQMIGRAITKARGRGIGALLAEWPPSET